MLKGAWIWCSSVRDAIGQRVSALCGQNVVTEMSGMSIHPMSAGSARTHFPADASFTSRPASQDWRPLKAHLAMHRAIKMYQKQNKVHVLSIHESNLDCLLLPNS